MRYIHLTVHESDITLKKGLNINRVPLTSGSVNDIACRFEFSSKWNDFPIKVASFTGSGTTISVAITDHIAIIPWECLKTEGGELLVAVTGACDLPDTNSYRQLNTEEISLGVIVSGSDISSDVTDNPPSPDIAEQLLAAVNDIFKSEEERKNGYSDMAERLKQVEEYTEEHNVSTMHVLDSHISDSFYSDEGVHNFRIKDNFLEFYNGESWEVLTFKKNYSIMSVNIDLRNSLSTYSVSYADDAVGSEIGGNHWDTFFGHYPVLLENGVEKQKVEPSNFAKFLGGKTLECDDGSTNDLCIAFPRRGIRIVKTDDTMTVSMTDHPNLYGFEYCAHQVGNEEKDVFYVGAYKSSLTTNADGKTVLASVPGKYISRINDYYDARTYAENKNAKLFSHYQRLFIQCMFILKYKTLDSQATLGYGLSSTDVSNEEMTTGLTDQFGMDSKYLTEEQKTSGIVRAKAFGLEDIWGNIYEWLDGIKTDNSYIKAAKADDSYEVIGSFNGSYNNGYINSVIGTTKCGFIPDKFTGSNTMSYTDWGVVNPNSHCIVCGDNTGGRGAGLFCIRLGEKPEEENMNYEKSARIMYI